MLNLNFSACAFSLKGKSTKFLINLETITGTSLLTVMQVGNASGNKFTEGRMMVLLY
jgi:membrane-bound inhibitor of C-type lysozyme